MYIGDAIGVKYRENILIKKRSILCTIVATKSRYASQKSKLTADEIKIGSETETETETDTFSRNSDCCLTWFGLGPGFYIAYRLGLV